MNTRYINLIIGILVLSITALLGPLASFAQEVNNPLSTDDPLILSNLLINNQLNGAKIVIKSNKPFDFFTFYLEEEGNAIAIDPVEKIYCKLKGEFVPTQQGLVTKVKIIKGLGDRYDGFTAVDMIVLELERPSPYNTSQEGNLISVDIGKVGLAEVKKPELYVKIEETKPVEEETKTIQAIAEPELEEEEEEIAFPETEITEEEIIAPDETLAQMKEETKAITKITPKRIEPSKEKGIATFKECLRIATNNYTPLLITEEEINLAEMKVNEAKRAIYPQATAKYTYTDGDVYGIGFREVSRGVQVEQPLYYSGRLGLALKQAEVNRDAAKEKYNEVEAEIAATITEKFYELTASKLNFEDQKGLIKKVHDIHSLAQKRFEKALSTKLEILNVESQLNQVEYQLAVAEKEVELAKIELLQVMNMDPSKDIDIQFNLDYEEKDIDLNRCLELAFENRPELRTQELLYEASRLEEFIAKSKDNFKVDCSAFLGESGGAYYTEDLKVSEDWYVGLKVTKPFGSNTASYNYTRSETSAKLGQTTRTGAITHSAELAVLDNLAGTSEKQSALVGRLKAENEVVELKKTINLDVRGAYTNYQKALLQLKNTEQKIKFREEELKISEAKADLNEVFLSQVLEAHIKLVDEKSLYHQAIASYKTALANLNKAIGLIGYFN